MKINNCFARKFIAALGLAALMMQTAFGDESKTNTAGTILQADSVDASKTNKLLASREGADEGAKPCKYDSCPRPSILMTPARLAQIRQDVLQGKGKRWEVYEQHIKSNADLWLHRPIVIPGIGGWAHNFFCTDGTMLELPEDQLFDPNKPSRCPVCGKTYLNPKILGARRFFEHYWLVQAARDLALTYAIEQKKEYAAQAAMILTKYADAYPHELGEGGFQSMTLCEAVCLIPLAESYDLIYDTLTPEQRQHIERDFFWPAAQSLTQAGFNGNWGSWHLSAIGVIGYATRHQRFIDFATAQFKSQIADQLGDDGLWPESVGTYHFYALDAFSAFAEAADNCGNDLFSWQTKSGKGLEAMYEAPLRYAYPNLRLAAINDGWYEAYLPQDQYTVAYYHYRRPEFAWVIREMQRTGKPGNPGEFLDMHYRNLLYGEPLPAKIPRPVFGSTNFPVLGITILRQGSNLPADKEMVMTFHYGPFLGHGHYDKMGVTFFANGKQWVPDFGTTGYATELSHFLESAPGHNTIVVDGKNQKRTTDRHLVAFADTPELKLAVARTSELAPKTTWTRTVMLADHYALIWDRIDSAQEHQFDWLLHAQGKQISLHNASEDQSSTHQFKREFPYPLITGVKKYVLNGNSTIARWTAADGELTLWTMNRPGQTAFTGNFPTPDANQVPLLALRQKTKHAEFLAVLRPETATENISDDQVQFHREADGSTTVSVKIDGREDQIHLGSAVKYKMGDAQPVTFNLKESASLSPAN